MANRALLLTVVVRAAAAEPSGLVLSRESDTRLRSRTLLKQHKKRFELGGTVLAGMYRSEGVPNT
jgi:hypothetical protein